MAKKDGALLTEAEQRATDDAWAYILRNNYVTFVELGKVAAAHIETKGDWCAHSNHPGAENVIYWMGMSESFYKVFDAVMNRGAEMVPAHWLTYLADGAALRIPMVKRRTAYKKPHWLPVCLCRPGTKDKDTGRKGRRPRRGGCR